MKCPICDSEVRVSIDTNKLIEAISEHHSGNREEAEKIVRAVISVITSDEEMGINT